MLSKLSRLPGLGNMASYVALLDRARDSRSLGDRQDMMDSKSPYSRIVWISGHVEDDVAVVAFGVTALDVVDFAVAAFAVDTICAFFREHVTARSSSERLRLIVLVSVPIMYHFELSNLS